jgi:hypothetical protein
MMSASPPKVGRSRFGWWPLAVAAVALGILVYAALPARAPEPGVLRGRWAREDGDYTLAVKDVRIDGSADVEYLNPNSIHVGAARAGEKEGKLVLSVELRDENYPGSTYSLVYDRESDQLRGEYYQAVEQSTFPVVFRRSTNPR